MNRTALVLLAVAFVALSLAGCTGPAQSASDCWKTASPNRIPAESPPGQAARVADASAAYQALGFAGSDATGSVKTAWPDLHGEKVQILDHGAFSYAFGEAKKRFEALTNGTVEHTGAQDAGGLLEQATLQKDHPTADVLYGLDNVLVPRAIAAGLLAPYRPLLAPRIDPAQLFLDPASPWLATPVDSGYIAVNADPRHGTAPARLGDLVGDAKRFVTEDPRTSSPGLGFLVSTVATFGESCYLGYWKDLLAAGALVAPDWTTAYATHFSGGYGQGTPGFLGDRSLVTSYTTSPAYELFYGSNVTNQNVLAAGATFHQVETMALVKGAAHPAAAEAWIEFTLTDAFQDLLAPNLAVYPVVSSVDVSATYGGHDPAPGTFQPAAFSAATIAAKAPAWVRAWTDVYEASKA